MASVREIGRPSGLDNLFNSVGSPAVPFIEVDCSVIATENPKVRLGPPSGEELALHASDERVPYPRRPLVGMHIEAG